MAYLYRIQFILLQIEYTAQFYRFASFGGCWHVQHHDSQAVAVLDYCECWWEVRKSN